MAFNTRYSSAPLPNVILHPLRDEIIGQIDIYIRRYEAPDAHLPQIHPR